MKFSEIKNMLSRTGIPTAYHRFNSGQRPPYICFYIPSENNFSADGRVFHSFKRLRVDLYTAEKDEAAEAAVEAALKGFYYTKDEEYLDDIKCYQIIYQLEV